MSGPISRLLSDFQKRLPRSFVKHQYSVLWIVLFAALVSERLILISLFTGVYLDDDQSIMWNGALEYSKGNFYEPFFFGQDYNTMIEALFSIPLIQSGISYAISLSSITSLLTLLPFVILSIHYFRKKAFHKAYLILSIALLLPVEYGMLTSIPRGFVPGIFIAFFGAFSVIKNPRNSFWFVFFSAMGTIANPNASLLVVPFGALALMKHFKNVKFYRDGLLGLIIPATLWFLAKGFYETHPEYIVHHAWDIDFSFDRITIYNWDSLFKYVTPLFWNAGLAIPMFLIIALLGFKQRKIDLGFAVLLFIVFLLVALSNSKVLDGINSVFYSHSRMFIAIPLLMALFISFLKVGEKTTALFVTLALSLFVYKLTITQGRIEEHVSPQKEKNMYVMSVEELKRQCLLLSERAKEVNAELILVHYHLAEKHMLTYACPCLIEELPPSIAPLLDRRTWKLKEVDDQVYSNVLLIGVDEGDIKIEENGIHNYVEHNDYLKSISFTNNGLTTEQLLESLEIPMRKH